MAIKIKKSNTVDVDNLDNLDDPNVTNPQPEQQIVKKQETPNKRKLFANKKMNVVLAGIVIVMIVAFIAMEVLVVK